MVTARSMVATQWLGRDSLTFTVRGRPVPQGALVRSPSGGLYHRGRGRLDAWRGDIATEARAAMQNDQLWTCPVTVKVWFVLERPKHHYLPANGSRPEPVLRLDAPRYVTAAPDIDKLLRALLDAITHVVIRDDGQVAGVMSWKVFEDEEMRPGVQVEIVRLAETR